MSRSRAPSFAAACAEAWARPGFAGRTALEFDGRRLTYAEFAAQVGSAAAGLKAAGIGRGELVAQAWSALADAERALARTELDAGERADRLELVSFHLAELGKAQLTLGEDEDLERTRDVLRHADRLHTLCGEAYGLLYEQEFAALSTLGQVWKRLTELSNIDETFAVHAAARESLGATRMVEGYTALYRELLLQQDAVR